MVKEPWPGRVKTRLGQGIGLTRAAWWYRHQTRALLRRIADPRWRIVLAVSPDHAGLASRVWPRYLERLPQGSGDLGKRMARMLRATPGPTVLIGSDIPGVSPAHLARAFSILGRRPSVLGPAPDGGYWLIGLRHPGLAPSGFLQNVRWSHPKTLNDTLPTLPGPVGYVNQLSDVDKASDLA
ncbi:MAG: glycosyltransferase [Paracoccaceae bacterium]|nr:glycosyltransferase [Paracoccaceae bacterium]